MDRNKHVKAIAIQKIARDAVHGGKLDVIESLYKKECIDSYDLGELIALLRTTSCYKKDINMWTYAIVCAYNLCKNECSLPHKEMWGMI